MSRPRSPLELPDNSEGEGRPLPALAFATTDSLGPLASALHWWRIYIFQEF